MSESDWVFDGYERVISKDGFMWLKAWYVNLDTGERRWVLAD